MKLLQILQNLMPLVTDWGNNLILVTSPTTQVSGQELHDFVEDEMAAPEGMGYPDILKPEGKIEDPSQPGVFSQIILILSSTWQVQFWGGSGYTRLYGAKLVGGVNDQPFKATGTANDITVLESPVDGVTVAVVSESASAIEDMEFDDGIWIDTNGGSAGTAYPLGKRTEPVNNFADAVTIANARSQYKIRVIEDAVLLATDNIDNFTIYGSHASKSQITLTPGCSTSFTQFYDCALTGTAGGNIVVRDSVADDLFGFEGILHQTAISGTLKLAGAGTRATHILSCYSGIPGVNTPELDFDNLNISVGIRDIIGGIKLVNKSGDSSVSVDSSSGQTILDGTVTAGTIVCRGNNKLIEVNGTEIRSGTWNGVTIVNEATTPESVAYAVWMRAISEFFSDRSTFGGYVSKSLLSLKNFLGNK